MTAGRDDNMYAFTVALRTTLLRRVTVALLFQNSRNSSNNTGYGFSSHQIGLEIGYRF